MANHLTPEELSHELGIDRDTIIKLRTLLLKAGCLPKEQGRHPYVRG